MIKTFRDLEVYQEAYQLMLMIHRAIKKLPVYERNDLASQMRRASKSCPANIAEGWAKRRFEKEFKRHLDAAIGSANEMEVHKETGKPSSIYLLTSISSFQHPVSIIKLIIVL